LAELRFRIPTPLFGLGLIEAIEDATILKNEGPKAHGGEAAEVIKNFSGASGAAAPLSTTESQNLVNFLRSL